MWTRELSLRRSLQTAGRFAFMDTKFIGGIREYLLSLQLGTTSENDFKEMEKDMESQKQEKDFICKSFCSILSNKLLNGTLATLTLCFFVLCCTMVRYYS